MNDIDKIVRSEFLEKLAQLCDDYKATFSYSHDDDGIYICLDGKEIFCGFIHDEGASKVLRDAIGR